MPYVAIKRVLWNGRLYEPGATLPKDQELAKGQMHRRRQLFALVPEGHTVERLGMGRWRAVPINAAPASPEPQEPPPPAPSTSELDPPTPAPEPASVAVEPVEVVSAPSPAPSTSYTWHKKKSGKKR